MKVYTKTGDRGKTSLIGGDRVSKSNLRIEAYGTVDELNSHLGMVRDQEANASREDILLRIQDRLFTIGSTLAVAPGDKEFALPEIKEVDVFMLEKAMDEMDEQLPEMRNFVLPGGHVAISATHIARTVCRRAERRVTALAQDEEVPEIIIQYLNRLSDYLFVLARMITRELGVQEYPWKPDR